MGMHGCSPLLAIIPTSSEHDVLEQSSGSHREGLKLLRGLDQGIVVGLNEVFACVTSRCFHRGLSEEKMITLTCSGALGVAGFGAARARGEPQNGSNFRKFLEHCSDHWSVVLPKSNGVVVSSII
jgi:hypothetical protein